MGNLGSLGRTEFRRSDLREARAGLEGMCMIYDNDWMVTIEQANWGHLEGSSRLFIDLDG